MARSSMIREEIAQQGQTLYQQWIRSLVETAENTGKMISIDIGFSAVYAI